MALTPIGGFLAKSPRCTEPPKYGLLNSIDLITPGDVHWQASGIEWEDTLCSDGTVTFINLCPPATGFSKPAERNFQFPHADPFIALGSFDCTPVGRPAAEAFDIARTRLLAWEQRQVENTFWTGITQNGTVQPNLATGSTYTGVVPVDINAAGALNPVEAMAAMEEALGDLIACGATLHIPERLLSFFVSYHLLTDVGGILYSPAGLKVIAGHGYPGSGPNNVAASAGQMWMFGTGPLLGARSNIMMVPDTVPEAVNRVLNNVTVRAERFYAIGFSCSLLAVRVNLTRP
jgi:hypothetical protein